jgi:hypothetical protein
MVAPTGLLLPHILDRFGWHAAWKSCGLLFWGLRVGVEALGFGVLGFWGFLALGI